MNNPKWYRTKWFRLSLAWMVLLSMLNIMGLMVFLATSAVWTYQVGRAAGILYGASLIVLLPIWGWAIIKRMRSPN